LNLFRGDLFRKKRGERRRRRGEEGYQLLGESRTKTKASKEKGRERYWKGHGDKGHIEELSLRDRYLIEEERRGSKKHWVSRAGQGSLRKGGEGKDQFDDLERIISS